ncbi:hypothetical protein DESUT3_38500 [Desulfuromonas versatilis]|uniref:Short chain amide porin n=1 Tax=Desulfuromonas versatilis TaxID=2802975 RepID=A0ABN6E379_9BACT|nr:porin [Desulfuromonas versatilis]BCR06781.1 hypothetical protein DESUT3_38500 [Desulfuromonas versatilis]
MRGYAFLAVALLAGLLLAPAPVRAGAILKISDDSQIDLGFRLQALYLASERDRNGDGDFEDYDDFKVRRARIRLGADITQWVSAFMQTEFAEDPGVGADARIIDAFIVLKPHKLAHLYLGENMAPVLRQNLTSSGALMAIDRPALAYKNLTWGTRAPLAFTNTNFTDFDAGLRGDVDVRDTGLTLFGSDSLSPELHFKYYLGVYDGVQESSRDSERYAGRVQFNFLEAEPGYYNSSTYLGTKKTLGIGLAFDLQDSVAREQGTGDNVDYAMYSFDLFCEHPLGPGSLSAEFGYVNLDLDDAGLLVDNGGGLLGVGRATGEQAQGEGFYLQAGYFIDNWQPWIDYEIWESDGPGDRGSFQLLRFGLSYFIKGHNANIKLGYEVAEADEDFAGTREDTLESFVTGLYVTY